MALQEVTRVGKRGTIVIPAELRRRYGIEEGSFVILEESEKGLLINGAFVMPIESYTPERKAEFLLNNAVSERDYQNALEEVRGMGLDPESIPHKRPWED
jgi:AbrB family looped-hinge helix DNA binding protein